MHTLSLTETQIAAAAGGTVIATSSSAEKLEVAKKLGATHLVNYRETQDWASEVLKVTDGKGVDLTVDVVGAQSIEQTLKCTAFGGLVCLVGMLSENPRMPVNVMADLLFGAKTSKPSFISRFMLINITNLGSPRSIRCGK